MLQGKNVFKQINESEILTDISLDVKPSKISCLIGPSGSGKTTIINCLSLLSPPSKGVITLDGQDYLFGNEINVAYKFPYPLVTVVFQGLFLFPHMTNEKNILLPLLENKKDMSGFDELVDRLKVGEILKKYPNECSGGEKQRIALVRQILLEPRYLLLDEITSALDLETVNTVADILIELRNKSVGILLATHMINLAKKICADFYFIDKGVMIESGDISKLQNPETERLRLFLQVC
jgi:ABC-type polar amino acid transport system ATPase subunit